MSLLDQFEEEKKVNDVSVPDDQESGTEKETEEIDLKAYIDDTIEKKIASAKAGEILAIAKTETLKANLLFQQLEEQKKVFDEAREKSNVLLENIVSETQKFNRTTKENIDIFRDELMGQNQLFIKAVNESKVFETMENIFNSKANKINYAVQEELNKKSNELNATIEKLNDKIYTFNSIYMKLWVVILVLFLIILGLGFYYNSKINTLKDEFKALKQVNNSVLNILSEDSKFWYSEKDKKAYFDNIERIKKAKKNH